MYTHDELNKTWFGTLTRGLSLNKVEIQWHNHEKF